MKYWEAVYSEENWNGFFGLAEKVLGFDSLRLNKLNSVKLGDIIFCYMTGGRGYFAKLKVTRELFVDKTPIWNDNTGELYEHRLGVQVLQQLPQGHGFRYSPTGYRHTHALKEIIDRSQAEEIVKRLNYQSHEQPKDIQQAIDYDPNPVDIDDAAAAEDDVEGLNIVLDDGSDEDDSKRSWFFIHCYSGYEKKVEHALRQRIDSMGMQDQIYDVLIPTEDEIEVKDGKRRTVEKRVFPGYVMVQMRWNKEEAELDKDAWYTVRNTPGVVGFVGGENQPTPLRDEEVKRIMDRMDSEDMVVKVDYKIGERVRIVGGPFNDFPGTVASIDSGREKVRVMVDFFGRETAVVLSFMEVERM